MSGHGRDTREHPSTSSSTSSSSSSARSSGKCPLTHFLLCSLTVAQVGLLSLFLVWTIKTCYSRYQRVIILYPVESNPHLHSNIITSKKAIVHLHGNQSNNTSHLINDIHDERTAFTNKSIHRDLSIHNRDFTIVGTTHSRVLALTLKWLESLMRLNKSYDVTLLVEDQRAYKNLSQIINRSKNLEKTRLVARRRLKEPQVKNSSLLSDSDVILKILTSGKDVLYTSTDSNWLKDPMPGIWESCYQCHVCIQRGKSELQGFIFLKSSPNVISGIKALETKVARRKAKSLRSSTASADIYLQTLKTGFHRFSTSLGLNICYL
ncbi:uncharacterized protein LOC121422931 [Lytechinus variegatus]|uniref:uncharacterized protein LOC121422931 n=1 Tax=Lytechinus variegatus TaxID=7654 RepID=UPI001BB21BF1|nr:uncharacterized protein LOC121422931 [Lytechinus variegatus]